MFWKALVFFSFSISAASSFSLVNTELSMAASILFLPQRLERAQALRSVTWMSRSQRSTGMPCSSLVRTAASISSPGETPRSAPSRRWNEESTRLASSRKPLPSLSTWAMFRFSQLFFSTREA